MGRVVVDVMPKPEILDPQGKAVVGALPRLGFTQFVGVRQGKRFELEVDTTAAVAKWNIEVEENLAQRAAEQAQ